LKKLRVSSLLSWVLICCAAFSCASCLSMSLPKSASVEPSGKQGEPGNLPGSASDKALVDTWELAYQVNEKGEQERPRESTRTLIEFTDRGTVIFNRMDKDNSGQPKSRTGRFTTENSEINITDDVGNTVKWPYAVKGETLVIVMPEKKKEFHWRRSR
jgi:hypothetical protein